MSDLDKTIKRLIEFRDNRDWAQFHNSKDLSIALSIETSELLELFLWKDNEDFDRDKLKDELADVLCYALMLADKNNLDITQIINDKIDKNSLKYPIQKSRGTAKKYTEL